MQFMPLSSLGSRSARSVLWILLWSLLCGVGSAQARRFQEDWRWAHFDLHDGLPSLRILSIAEDMEGTLWVQTAKGPAWFDGFRWNPIQVEVVSPLDTTEPIHAFGSEGILVKNQTRQLLWIRKSGTSEVVLPRRLRKHAILQILGDREGGCFLLLHRMNSGQGIRLLYHRHGQPVVPVMHIEEVSLPEDLSRTEDVRIHLGSAGEVFFVTQQQAWAWVDGTFLEAVALPEPGWSVQAITSDGRGRIGRLLAKRSLGGDVQTRIGHLSAGSAPEETALWESAADGGFLRSSWVRSRGFVGQADLPSGRSIVVLQGRECQFLEGGKWRNLDPLPSSFLGASCLLWTSDGRLCVGTVRGLSMCQYDSALWARSDIDDFDCGRIKKVLGDREGTLWAIGEKGLFAFTPEEDRQLLGGSRGRDEHLRAVDIIEDRSGQLWASDSSGGLHRRIDGRWEALTESESVPGLISATFLGVDALGPWVKAKSRIKGLPRDRLLRWTGTRFEDWAPWKQSVYGLFHEMVAGPDGTLWFGGMQGISRFQNGSWKIWNRDQGLIRNSVESLALDARGRLWFLQAGVALGSLSDTGEVSYVSHAGLADYDCPRSLVTGVDGRLWSHTDTRLRLLPAGPRDAAGGGASDPGRRADWVDIDLPPGWAQQHYVQVQPTQDRLYFLNSEGDLWSFDIQVGDSRPPILELELPRPHVGGVSLAWTARSWMGAIPAANVLTRHRLDSDSWSTWSRDHRLDLWNLDAGPHQVHVQARNRLGRPGIAFVSGVFQVPAPFWMRPAFVLPISALLSLLLVTLFLWAWNTRRQARVLEINRKKLETMAEMSPVGILHADERGVIQFRNQRGEAIVGMSLDGQGPEDYLLAIHEADRERVRQEWLSANRAGSDFESRFRFQHRDGSLRWVMGQVVPEHDEKGRVIAHVGTLTDITEMELAAAERKRLEERLVQAQKLESVGQLAGGIAHDFNNLLQVILGYTDFLDERLKVDGSEDPDLAQIKHSAERATELTRQLLAFSRKQQGRPRPLNPVRAVREVLAMICRILPENMTIEFDPVDEIGTICMDGNQFEQILLNLCLNARDAMPDGGLLRISLENVSILASEDQSGAIIAPGRYVLLRVADTGVGMSEAVSNRLFEPFFTTKEPGKGTGLGMAMVYGIVRQNEGVAEVESELGEGTELRIYLPRVEGQLELGEATPVDEQAGGGETILIAEDEDLVRDLARTMLERAGYHVLTAVDGEDAIEVFQEHREEISVVLLDAIMPRCGGREVYERLSKMDPDVAFLFSSGHPANQLPGTFLEENRLVLIPKPYKARQLLKEVRGVLERKTRR